MMDYNIGGWPEAMAERHPERIALVDGVSGARSDYAELAERVGRIAGALDGAGVTRGSRVAVLSTNRPDMLAVLFAIARIGAVAVPVNFRLTAGELAYILTDAEVSFLFASGDLAETATELTAQVPVPTVLLADDPGTADSLESFIAGAGPGPAVEAGEDDLVFIMYTSGTTGRPKGAMLTHGNVTWNAINMISAGRGLQRGDVTLSVAPLFHIGALGIFTLPLLYLGGTVVTVPQFDPATTAQLMARERVTVQFLVPAMWNMLIRSGALDRFDDTAIRWVLSGGAPCPGPVIGYFVDRGWAFLEGFGLTETSPTCTVMDAEALHTKAGSVGRPLRHVDCRIVDSTGREVPAGSAGELLVRGPSVFVGYWRRPEATAEALVDGWFHTGDIAVRDDDGYVSIIDRKKDMVITGGENVYPAEVEQVLAELPGIVEAAVIGVPDEKWGESVTAVVVTDAELGPDEVIAHCRRHLAGYKTPRSVLIVDELPRNATGKILKGTLRTAHGAAR